MPSPPLIDPGLLDLLLHAPAPMSVEALALERGLDRSRLLRELNRLRRAGCRFDHHPRRGLELIEAGLGTWVDYLEHVLRGPRMIECYRRTGSTQDACRRLLEQRSADAEGAVVTADEQTAGRGRLGRRWIAPPGAAAMFSRVCLHPDDGKGAAVDRLTLTAGVAVARALETMLADRDAPPRIKWPNDIYVHGGKIAGILVETAATASGPRGAVLGVGVNVGLREDQMPRELCARINSLAMCGVQVDRLRVLARCIAAVDDALRQPPTTLLPEWRQRCAMMHEQVRLRSGGRLVEGEVVDLDPDLGLIVRAHDGAILHLPAATTTVVT